MKNLFFVTLMSLVFILAQGKEIPKEKLDDTMLFGDVRSGDEHIPFATILVKGTTVGTAADVTGHYKLVGIPEGEQEVVVSAVGYQAKAYEFSFKIGEPITLTAELEPDQIGLEQVVITADRSEKSRHDASTIVSTISPKLLETTQSVTLSEGLSFTPGLRMENNCQNCGFTQVRMNGLEGPYSQILINSRPVFSGLAGVYGLELIPANMIDRVEVVRGGGSALFGSNAIAGTINLITKEPVQDIYSINSSVSVIGADESSDFNLSMNGSVVSEDYRSGMSFYGFKRERDPYDANGDDFSEMSAIENGTFGASFFKRMGLRSKINLDYFFIEESRRGGSDFDLPNHEAAISEAVDHQINSANLTFDQFMRDHDKLSFFAAMQQVERGSYYGAGQDLSAYGLTKDLAYSVGSQYHRDIDQMLFSPSELMLGLEMTSDELKDQKLGYLDVETMEHVGTTTITDQSVQTFGFFAQNEWVAEQWRLSLGFRVEHYAIADEADSNGNISGNVFSPRASVLFNLSEQVQLRSSFARGYRAPQIFDEDLHIETSGARKVIHKNDPNLEQENSHSATFSVDISQNWGRWQAQLLAEGFYTALENPFTNQYGTPDANGQVVYTRTNAEDGAKVDGVNLELNASPGPRWMFQSGFTFQKSRYETPQEFNERRFFRTPNSYGYLALSYSPTAAFKASVTGNYTGKMLVPYFGNTLVNPEGGQLNEVDPFFDLGLKLSQTLELSGGLSLQLYAGVKNLFDAYQDDFDYGVDRDPGYIYGPLSPRTFYFGVKLGNIF
ncbi:TonB-dependent receptor [Sunxiuqinia sp. sy24]|uniref:TonB-dependent receptor n=1 Tax=Sunxiuqinia sp. sy24 TaxID=3461495 RepID=UPI004045FE39